MALGLSLGRFWGEFLKYVHLITLTGFLHAKAALARVSRCNSVCPSVHLSDTWVDQSKTVQAGITKSSPSAARKTLVSGTVKLFHKFERGHAKQGH